MRIDDKTYGELLTGCIVIGRTIGFSKALDFDMLNAMYTRLADDLFARRIPHYRVVGIWHDYDDKHDKSLFRVNDIFGQSCIELSRKMKYLVPEKIGGNDGNLGCFYGVSEDMSEFSQSEDFKGFCRDWGLDNGRSIESRTANILNVPRSKVGSLMMDTSHDDLPQKHEFTTSDVWYTQRMPYDVKFPRVLVPNKFLTNLQDTVLGKAPTFMFIMKGTGEMSYEQTQELFNARCEYIMPCDTLWDLSMFFVIRVPMAGDTVLRLTCFENIDEGMLQNILRDYGKELLGYEC